MFLKGQHLGTGRIPIEIGKKKDFRGDICAVINVENCPLT